MPDPAAPRTCLPPRPLSQPPRQRLPEGACDCHFHVFAPGAALDPRRGYTPPDAPLAAWTALADAIGIARGVIVQPSVYGFDNRVHLAALAALPDRLRAVLVIPPETPAAEVARLDGLGVRGVRLNLRNPAGLGIEAAAPLARLIAPQGWHLQFLTGPAGIEAVGQITRDHGITAVIDHLAHIAVDTPEAAADLARLQRLLDGGRAYVKLSAPYRLGSAAGFAAAVRQLAASHPERLVWGTDWPHPDLYDAAPDDAEIVDGILDALGSEALRRQVLVATPAALYGF